MIGIKPRIYTHDTCYGLTRSAEGCLNDQRPLGFCHGDASLFSRFDCKKQKKTKNKKKPKTKKAASAAGRRGKRQEARKLVYAILLTQICYV